MCLGDWHAAGCAPARWRRLQLVAVTGFQAGRLISTEILQDEHLKPLLDMYRRAGRKVFLATNSLWDYTNVVMNFVVDGRVGSDRSTGWLQVCLTLLKGPVMSCEHFSIAGWMHAQIDSVYFHTRPQVLPHAQPRHLSEVSEQGRHIVSFCACCSNLSEDDTVEHSCLGRCAALPAVHALQPCRT